ncbi:MAG: PAS domain S-box protein [Thermodesulfovibrionales bacterium]|nr:PAS domain S-box protein [Thermodesulfovibrionales bacterium]
MTIRTKSLLILGSIMIISLLFGAGIVRNTIINLKEADRLEVTLDYFSRFIDIREEMSLLMGSVTDCMLQDVSGSMSACRLHMDEVEKKLDSLLEYVNENEGSFLNYEQRVYELELILALFEELKASIGVSFDVLRLEGKETAFDYLDAELEPEFENRLLVYVNDSIERGSREVESSYLQLLLYTNVIPVRWKRDDTVAVDLHNAMEYLIGINTADMHLHMQAKELKDYLVTLEEGHRVGFLGKSDDIRLAFNRWFETVLYQRCLGLSGEDNDLQTVRGLINDYEEFESTGLEIISLARAGDMARAMMKLRTGFDPFMADRIQVPIHSSLHDAREGMSDAFRAIQRKTLGASAEIILFLAIVVVSLTTIILSFILGFTKSLTGLEKATEEIGRGNLDHRLSVISKDELGDLSRFIDMMAEDLKNVTVSRDYSMSVLDMLPEVLIEAREDGSIRTVNTALGELLGYQKDELLGNDIHTIAPGLVDTPTLLAEIRGTGPIFNHETYFIAKDGRRFLMEFSASAIADDHSGFRGLVLAAKDITDRRKMEKDLQLYRDHLAELVKERTGELEAVNMSLEQKVREVSELRGALLEREEMERKRLGHDLHDGLGQVLTGLSMKTLAHAKSVEGVSSSYSEQAMEIKEVIEQAKADVRRLVRVLSFGEAGERGLVMALEELADSTSKFFPVKCTFSKEGEIGELDSHMADNLYRIAQEAVTNAVRHGRPDNIFLRLSGQKDTIELAVEDDGTGLAEREGNSEGLGLKIMSYRCESIGANFSINSAGDSGTLVACTLPVGKVMSRDTTGNEEGNGDDEQA